MFKLFVWSDYIKFVSKYLYQVCIWNILVLYLIVCLLYMFDIDSGLIYMCVVFLGIIKKQLRFIEFLYLTKQMKWINIYLCVILYHGTNKNMAKYFQYSLATTSNYVLPIKEVIGILTSLKFIENKCNLNTLKCLEYVFRAEISFFFIWYLEAKKKVKKILI